MNGDSGHGRGKAAPIFSFGPRMAAEAIPLALRSKSVLVVRPLPVVQDRLQFLKARSPGVQPPVNVLGLDGVAEGV